MGGGTVLSESQHRTRRVWSGLFSSFSQSVGWRSQLGGHPVIPATSVPHHREWGGPTCSPHFPGALPPPPHPDCPPSQEGEGTRGRQVKGPPFRSSIHGLAESLSPGAFRNAESQSLPQTSWVRVCSFTVSPGDSRACPSLTSTGLERQTFV